MAGLLNLTDADESGFDALPPGTYQSEVFEVKMAETKGRENAALPKGTPMIKIQFKVLGDREGETEIFDDDEGKKIKLDNRRLFGQWVIPPKQIDGVDYEHYEKMNGQLVRLFKALGFADEEIRNKKGFDPDFERVLNVPVLVTVGRDTEHNSNPVKGVKPMEAAVAGGLL